MKVIIAGVDEVGRGSLIGPVYAAAVILKKKLDKKKLKDSKKLTKKNREILEKYIKKNSYWSIGSASLKEIEKLNILNASLLAMKRAIKKLNKMLNAINIKRESVYITNVVNYRPPNNRKPEPAEINRYSEFLREHVSIIDPKILILMGSTAMESLFGSKIKISKERGAWKEVIINNKTYLTMITFHPAYLLRQADQKKYSWADLKEIRKKIDLLKLKI